MPILIRYKTDRGIGEIIKEIDAHQAKVEVMVMSIGKGTVDKMRSVIRQKKKRPGGTGNLEKNIDMEVIMGKDIIGWGVGNIDKLNKNASWWSFVNFGVSQKGMRIPGRGKRVPTGAFVPGKPRPDPGSFQEGTWKKGAGNFSFVAKRGILHPLNYISKTMHWLVIELDKLRAFF